MVPSPDFDFSGWVGDQVAPVAVARLQRGEADISADTGQKHL